MSQQTPHGNIDQSYLGRKNDYLYRVSTKSLIRNEAGLVLVVKELGRAWWDLPGGGMDHDETIKSALSRELYEEVCLEGDFAYKIIAVDEPAYLPNANVFQVRLIFEVFPERLPSKAGADADEIAYIHPEAFKDASNEVEKKIYEYVIEASFKESS